MIEAQPRPLSFCLEFCINVMCGFIPNEENDLVCDFFFKVSTSVWQYNRLKCHFKQKDASGSHFITSFHYFYELS